ncbi:S24 family peptidase [Vibrio xiamenensis]|uniref:S24 family peptidase n=1 Tax=Vibrio xiamenensis TaxID=861298 RepID=UPI003CCB8EF2
MKRVEQFTGDSIYVFRYDGQLMVKRLQFSKDGLAMVSDNDTYKDRALQSPKSTTMILRLLAR